MGSAFDTRFAASHGRLASRFGETVTYSPRGGASSSITAQVGPERLVEELQEDGREARRVLEITVAPDDVAGLTVGDAFTVRTEEWSYGETVAESETSATLRLTRMASLERGGARLRRESVG